MQPFANLGSLDSVAVLVPTKRQPMTLGDGVKAAVLLFVAAIAQVSIFSQIHVFGGVPDLLLVTLVAVALLRGSVAGAVGGFFAGLLVDTASLGTLGLTSLVLTLAGYWIGRYGETTGRDRAHAPFLSVAVVTVLYAARPARRPLRARRERARRRRLARASCRRSCSTSSSRRRSTRSCAGCCGRPSRRS